MSGTGDLNSDGLPDIVIGVRGPVGPTGGIHTYYLNNYCAPVNHQIHRNNFINNEIQAIDPNLLNSWDDGYPSGGNYWSDYPGVDVSKGFNQDITGSDGFGDEPYYLLKSNIALDNYPLMRTQHLPIRINSDEEFLRMATEEGWGSHPLFIENYDICGNGYGYSIYIGNTTIDFIIRNCYLHEAYAQQYSKFFPGAGIALYNVHGNGIGIIDNIIRDNHKGIYFQSTQNVGLKRNIIEANFDGIVLDKEEFQSNIPSTGGNYGERISAAGDINNDGYADFIVGAPGAGINTQGEAYVYSGLDNTILHTFIGEYPNDDFGAYVAEAGDINLDGYDDVIISAPEYNNYFGKAYVYSGRNWEELYTFEGEYNWAGIPSYYFSVDGGGDVDGDGYTDVVIGMPGPIINDYYHGLVKVYSGRTGNLIWEKQGETPPTQGIPDFFGGIVVMTKNTGYYRPDVIVGADWWCKNIPGELGRGKVYHYDGLNGFLKYSYEGQQPEEEFGSTLSSGDVDCDGVDDIIIGGWRTLRAEIYSGTTGSLIYSFTGPSTDIHYGCDVSGAGDVNQDGYDDIIVSDPYTNGNKGHVYLYSGYNGVLLSDYNGLSIGNEFGQAISNAGDTNGDGFDDIIISSSSGITNIDLKFSSNNWIVDNNFMYNYYWAYDYSTNYWNEWYPVGGNYWTNYNGEDLYSGPDQNIPGSDGIGDTRFWIYYYYPLSYAYDNYPYMNPFLSDWVSSPP